MLPFALQAGAAFNLVCNLTSTLASNPAGEDLAQSAWTVTLRVDLDQRHWCVAECEEVMSLAQVTDTHIRFGTANEGPRSIGGILDRRTGLYSDRKQWPDMTIRIEGRCARAPFTGFAPDPV